MTLTTSYLGLKLAHPFILGASPVTGYFDNVRRAEDGGGEAIVMHSLFEERIAETAAGKIPGFEHAARELNPTSKAECSAEAAYRQYWRTRAVRVW